MKRDCWLDPYGQITYTPFGKHEDVAMQILKDEFPMENKTTPLTNGPLRIALWDERGFYDSFGETLEKRGWVRFTTTMDRWSCEHSIGFEDRYPRPTRAQIDRMRELTGFNYDDPESFSHAPYNFDPYEPFSESAK